MHNTAVVCLLRSRWCVLGTLSSSWLPRAFADAQFNSGTRMHVTFRHQARGGNGRLSTNFEEVRCSHAAGSHFAGSQRKRCGVAG